MTIADLLQWVNVAILPALYYIARLERRIMKLEILLAVHVGVGADKIGAAVQ